MIKVDRLIKGKYKKVLNSIRKTTDNGIMVILVKSRSVWVRLISDVRSKDSIKPKTLQGD